jgi:sugar/nucleoside kinase (ribokinase family)
MTPAGLFIGLTTFDLVHYVESFPRADEKIQATARWTGAGGPAANAAATFAALGGRATLLTAIGGGPIAKAALADLTGLGVEITDLATDDDLPISSAVADSSGQRTVVSLNAKGRDQEAMVERLPHLGAVDVVCIDSHYPALSRAALAALAEPRPPVVLDPGSGKPHLDQLMDESDHVIASRSLDPAASAAELLERVEEHDVELAAVSSGSEPILAALGDQRVELRVPPTEARDTVGAGDVLHGAHAYFLASGRPALEALEEAAAVAARSCEHNGARIG